MSAERPFGNRTLRDQADNDPDRIDIYTELASNRLCRILNSQLDPKNTGLTDSEKRKLRGYAARSFIAELDEFGVGDRASKILRSAAAPQSER